MNWNPTRRALFFLFLISLPAGLIAQTHIVSGQVLWAFDNSQGVNNVDVEVTGDVNLQVSTDLSGSYSFEVPTGSSITIRPVKTGDLINGVTIGDLLAIQYHILALDIFTDWYKYSAADFNLSQSLTTIDLVSIRQQILGIPGSMTPPSWHFFDASLDFSTVPPPAPFNVSVALNNITEDQEEVHFIGVKLGDVDGSADVTEFNDPMVWTLFNQELPAPDELFDVVFQAGFVDNLSGFQFALRFDETQMEFVEFESLNSEFKESDFGFYQVQQGEIRSCWGGDPTGLTMQSGQNAFKLRFRSLQEGSLLSDVLSIDPTIIPQESYTVDREGPFGVLLDFGGLPVHTSEVLSGSEARFFQNCPNPFTGATQISFTLPTASTVSIRVYDLNGREVLQQSGQFSAGYHEHRLEWDGPAGIYLGELRTTSGIQTIKMMKQ